jgi:5'(3')-deoxyribonucleotidase
MNISFDLDNTLVDLFSAMLKIYKKNGINKKTFKYWDMHYIEEETRKEVFEMFKNPDIMCNLDVKKGSIELIEHLKSEGHNVFVVTARFKEIENETINFVNKTFDVPCIVVGADQDKTKLLKSMDTHLWIDDHPVQVGKCQLAGISSIMISNDITEYNHYMRDQIFWFEDIESIRDMIDFFLFI